MPTDRSSRPTSTIAHALFPYAVIGVGLFAVLISITAGDTRDNLSGAIGVVAGALGVISVLPGVARAKDGLQATGAALGAISIILATTDMRGSLDERITVAVAVAGVLVGVTLVAWLIALQLPRIKR